MGCESDFCAALSGLGAPLRRLATCSGLTAKATHEKVLIVVGFCMFNRSVHGLAMWAPAEVAAYEEMERQLARQGYSTRA